ncbi:MAG TPA: hypothetical protein VKZ49_02915 [Polyangiaceae bacterium]|nr:hypothetical protein [Polyangiaceae bacterium]
MRGSAALGIPLLVISTGCVDPPTEAPDAAPPEPSPNASIKPAPLASGAELGGVRRPPRSADAGGRGSLPDAGPRDPVVLREDQPIGRDLLTLRDAPGVTLSARFIWHDLPAPIGVAELDPEALDAARKKSSLGATVDVAAAGRMRLVFDSPAYPVPEGTELRASRDAIGYALVWPDRQRYRVLPSGSLRALLGERRADVTPLVEPEIEPAGRGRHLGFATDRVELTTKTGKLSLERAAVPGAGEGAPLLCRVLVELIAAEPVQTCQDSDLPLKASFAWAGGGRIDFEVSAVMRRQELTLADLFFPPVGAQFALGELPPQAAGVITSRDDLVRLRRSAVVPDSLPKGAPGEGLIAENHSDLLRYVLLDGVAVAWVRAKSEQHLVGPRAGRYHIGWRDFFGTEVEPPSVIHLPARVRYGQEPDAGSPE